MVRVTIGKDETIEKALKRFKRECNKAGILKSFKRSSVYLKPSERRRLEQKSRLRNIRQSQKFGL
jgi:small subunit ribosomal protein S21